MQDTMSSADRSFRTMTSRTSSSVAARRLGLDSVPLLCAREIPVPGALPRVIRLLLHYHAGDGHAPAHVYLGEARALRADLDAAQ
jgi:chorismate mutase